MTGKATIYYCDIGDYLTRDEKLAIIKKLGSAANPAMDWKILQPNEHNDWINHRDDRFGEFIPLAPENKFDARSASYFVAESCGIATARDAWVDNYSKNTLISNLKKSITFYNEQKRFYKEELVKNTVAKIESIVTYDSTKISWTDIFLRDAQKGLEYKFDDSSLIIGSYRPFCKQNLYFNKTFIHRTYQVPKLFPCQSNNNFVICLEGTGGHKDFGCLITDKVPDYGFSGVHTHCFPLYWYEEIKQQNTLFNVAPEQGGGKYARRDAISDFALNQARKQYGAKTTKEDIFYYVYGFLHNPDYRTEFAADLKKMLPRIPLVGDSAIFWKYAKAGRELAQLHLHYEDYANEAAGVTIHINNAVYDNFEVTKMRFASKDNKSAIIYNPFITLTGIPQEAYEYVVNGRSAIEWIMESYRIKTHKESGIVNNPNDWAHEHHRPRYILDLLLSIITVSVRTVEIVKGLPKVEL